MALYVLVSTLRKKYIVMAINKDDYKPLLDIDLAFESASNTSYEYDPLGPDEEDIAKTIKSLEDELDRRNKSKYKD